MLAVHGEVMLRRRYESGVEVLRDMGASGAQPWRRILYASWAIPFGAFGELPVPLRTWFAVVIGGGLGMYFTEFGFLEAAKFAAQLAALPPVSWFAGLAGANVVSWWEHRHR